LEIDYEDRTIPNSSFLILNSSFLFLFALSREEILNLSQFVISSKIKHSPNVFAFTEQGVAMLSSVLRSPRAVHVNIEIMRARRSGSACDGPEASISSNAQIKFNLMAGSYLLECPIHFQSEARRADTILAPSEVPRFFFLRDEGGVAVRK
jgi:hypothetical protein